MFTREALLTIARSDPEALVDIIMALQEQVQILSKREAKTEKPPKSHREKIRRTTGSPRAHTQTGRIP
jgi:hypothetical protein